MNLKMKLITDIELIDKLIQIYFIKGTITNNYLLSGAYSQYISESKLFYVAKNTNACFLLEKNGFYQVFYYINNQSDLMVFDFEKPLVMEVLYRGEANRPNEIISYWEKCGFKQHIIRDHMSAYYNQLVFFDENDSVKVRFVENENEIIFAQRTIEETFDKYTGDIFSINEARILTKNQNLLCAYINEDLCGVIKFEIKQGIVMWGHFAIKEEFRGKGIATKLMQTFFRLNSVSPSTRFQMWVVIDNLKAKNIYQRIGFTFDNKISQSMLKIS